MTETWMEKEHLDYWKLWTSSWNQNWFLAQEVDPSHP